VRGNHLIGPLDPPSDPGDPPPFGVGDGLALLAVPNLLVRLVVVDNLIEDCFLGIRGGVAGETVLESNEVRTRARNLQFGSSRITAAGNRLLGPRSGVLSADELVAVDNLVVGEIALGATGYLEVQRNTFERKLGVRGSPAYARVADNSVGDLFVGGGGRVELEGNRAQSLQVKGVTDLALNGNGFAERLKARVAAGAELIDNEARRLLVRAGAATLQGNAVGGEAHVVADTAAIAGNTLGTLRVQPRRQPEDPPAGGEAFDIRDNTVGGALIASGAATVEIRRNTVAGFLKARARETMEVVGNAAQGIACLAATTGTDLTLADNRARGNAGPGLAVIGMEAATIENNVAADNGGVGLVVRRTARLTAIANQLTSNGEGGASIRVPPTGDCDEDVEVTIAELVTGLGIALSRQAFHRCDAADANRDREVTVEEVVLSVGSALGRADPLASSVRLHDNRVESNRRFGIDVHARAAVEATANRVLRNEGIPLAVHGLGPLSEARIAGNLLGLDGRHGLLVEAVDAASVRDNVVFSHRHAGILLRATPSAVIANNLVYGNGGAGIGVGLGEQLPSTGTRLTNNTLVANGWGIDVGRDTTPTRGTVIRDNILHENTVAGIRVAVGARPDTSIGHNINTDGYDGVAPGPTDLDRDPQLVAPAGADGVLGGEGFADDDFHLLPTSPAIDAGSAPAAELGVTGSVVAGGAADAGIVDLGYHYDATAASRGRMYEGVRETFAESDN
jgi:hypothetical protein